MPGMCTPYAGRSTIPATGSATSCTRRTGSTPAPLPRLPAACRFRCTRSASRRGRGASAVTAASSWCRPLDHIDLYWQRLDAPAAEHERFDDLGFDHAYRREIGDFFRWIGTGAEPCLTWVEGLRCVEMMEGAYRSAQQDGRVVEFPLHPELEP